MISSLDIDIAQTRLIAATEQMCHTLQGASRSMYVRDAADFCCAIADTSGRFIAYPQGIGVSGFLGLDVSHAVAAVAKRDPLEPGDVILTNDPYLSRGLSTHLPDIHAIAPYFVDGEIVGYGWAFVHASDVGGRVPSSVSLLNDSIFAEGLRIPPVKYVRRGVIDPGIAAVIRANSRTPDANDGDLQAMVAALATGRERAHELTNRHGATALSVVGEYAISQTASRARRVLSQLADGSYDFEDYLDNDGVSDIPLRIRLRVTVRSGHLSLDFTGTDPQVEAALNVATFGTAHTWVVTRLFALVGTLDRDIPLNGGLMDVIDMTAPSGTVLNPVEPAAVGVRHATTSRVNDVLSGALIQAAPRVLPVASSGLVVPVVFSHHDGTRASVQVVEPMVGGTGARFGSDGIDGRDSGISNLSNNPVEVVEANAEVRLIRYGVRSDSGGAGRWRGGCGLELEFEALSNGALLARGLERLRFRPWGAEGGSAGLPAELIINEGREGEAQLRVIDVYPLNRGDRVTLRTSGAGGYGDPFTREPEAVLADVEAGLVSVAAAEALYGVAIVDDAVAGGGSQAVIDVETTRRLRGAGTESAGWGFGLEREQWSSVFSPDALDRLARKLEDAPVSERAALKRSLISEVLTALPKGFPVERAEALQIENARALLDGLLRGN